MSSMATVGRKTEAAESKTSAAAADAAPTTSDAGLLSRMGIQTVAIVGLLVLAVFYTFYFAQDILMPIAAAAILSAVFMPLVRRVAGWGIPPAVSATVIVVVLLGSLAGGTYSLSEPVSEWRYRAPQLLDELQHKLRVIKRPVAEMQRASEEVEKITAVDDGTAAVPVQQVVVKPPSLLDRVLAALQNFGLQLALVVILLFFLISTGDLFRERLVRVMPTFADKKRAVTISRQVERQVSIYLLTITIINIGLGTCIGLGLYAIGLPNALLWGVMAASLNFIPYLGLFVGAAIVGVVAVVTFDELMQALAAPAIYIGFNIIEANFVTPTVLGRRFTLNPLVIFVAVIFWGWMWGVPGALLAVPLLVVVKAICDNVDALAPLGEFLRGR